MLSNNQLKIQKNYRVIQTPEKIKSRQEKRFCQFFNN